MRHLIKFETLSKEINKQIRKKFFLIEGERKNIRTLMKEFSNDFLTSTDCLRYYDENNNLYVANAVWKHIVDGMSSIGIEKSRYDTLQLRFKPMDINERFIYENGTEVNYEDSEYLKNIISKYNPINRMSREEKEKKKQEDKEKRKERKIKAEGRSLEKRIKRANTHILNFKKKLESNIKILSFDMEMNEKNRNTLLEIGFSLLDTKTMKYTNQNILIEEEINTLNGSYVPNNKDNFMFGETLIMKLDDAKEYFDEILEKSDFYVGHDLQNDLRHTKKEITKTDYFDTVNSSVPEYYGIKSDRMSLEKLSTALKLEPKFLHNAGNDAYYTLQSALKLVEEFDLNVSKQNKIDINEIQLELELNV